MHGDRLPNFGMIQKGMGAFVLITSGLFLVFFSFAFFFGVAQAKPMPSNAAAPMPQSAADGATIFSEKCSACHTIGGGKLVGPDLKDVAARRDTDWLERFISDPAQMLGSDPTAQKLLKENNNVRMPNLGLTKEEVEKVIDFLGNPGAQPAAPLAPAAAAGAGNQIAGQMVFSGQTPLANGGPPCITCHTVGGTGNLGGGQLGPDLTHVTQRLGQAGVTAALKNIVFPTMLGPFTNRPLTPTEQADLIAFLLYANQQQGPVLVTTPGTLTLNSLFVLGIGTAIAVGFFGIMLYFRSRQKQRIPADLPVRKS